MLERRPPPPGEEPAQEEPDRIRELSISVDHWYDG